MKVLYLKNLILYISQVTRKMMIDLGIEQYQEGIQLKV